MDGRVQSHPMNYCSVCSLAFQSNDALVDHILSEHNPYNASPYNPHFVRATQQQIANNTIDNMFQNPKNIRMNMQNQGQRTACQHDQDNPMNRAVTIETQNPHLQTLAEMHLRYSNTAYSPSMNVQTRNGHRNAHVSPLGNVAASTGQFHPTSEYQQEMTPIGKNLQVPCNPVQYPPTTNPEMQNNDRDDRDEDDSQLRYLLVHNDGIAISNPMQHNSLQNTYSGYTEPPRINLAGNASQPQPRAALGSCQNSRTNINTVKNIPGGNVIFHCKLCGQDFNKRTDAIKHKIEYHRDVKRGAKVIQTITNFAHSKQSHAPIPEMGRVESQQRNTGLYLPQAPPTIISITIDDDEPEQHNRSTFENRANNHPQQKQQHNSQNERVEVKNINKLSIRNPTAVNNLIFESQHKKSNEEDGNISNAFYNSEENRNVYKINPTSIERNSSHLFSESIASNGDERWENTNNNKIHPNSPHLNLHEFQDKRFQLSNVKSSNSSIDNDASKNNSGQYTNTVNAHESSENQNKRYEFCSQTVTPNADDASKYRSDTTEIQKNKSEGKNSSKTNECSDSESSKENDASDDNIIDENKTTQQESKTKKQMQSSSSHGECSKFNLSDFPINQNTMLNMLKNCMEELFLPTSNNTKEKSKYEPKQKLFKCRTCPKHFVEEKQLHKHIEKKCRNRRGKICNKCQLEFSKKSFKKHTKEHHKNENNLTLEDFDIVTGFSSTSSSDSSESSTSSDSSEKSEGVSPNFDLKSNEAVTSGGIQVEQSNRHENPKSLKDDLKLHTSVENDRKIPTSDDEKRTANSSHSSYNFVVLKCAKCEKCFYQVNFDRHKEVCGKSKIKKCDLCPLKFSTISLKKHRKDHHSTITSNTIRLIISENNNVRHETLILNKHKLQKPSGGSNILTKITKTQKGKFVIPSKLRHTAYKSYSKTIFQCGICNTCFATAPTLESHFNKYNHAIKKVEKCSICNLLFSKVSLKRHHNFHHRYLELKNKTDFIIKVIVKTRMAKNTRNSKKTFVSSVNNKRSLADPKGNTSSPLKKRKETSEKIIQYRRKTDQSQKRDEQKELTPEIPKNNSNQDQIITEMDLKDVNTLYNCLQCDLYFMENIYFQSHLAANHKLLIEPLHCTFCKRRFCVSLDSFRLHMALEFENKPINNLIIETSLDKTIQNSCNDFDDRRNDIKLKECVVKLTNIQSALVSTTSTNNNSGLEINLKEGLGSKMTTEYSDSSFPSLTATADYKDSQHSEDLGNNTYLSNNINDHENNTRTIINSRTESIQQLENYPLVETTAVNENDDLFTTEDTFEENLENKHSEVRELDFENGIKEMVNNKIENDTKSEVRNTVIMSKRSQKSIKILSNIVLKHPKSKDDEQPEICNKTQSKNLLKDNELDKNCVLVSSTDTNQVYGTKEQSPLILGNSNIIKDGDENVPDLHEKCELNSENYHSIHESAINIIIESNIINENFSTDKEDSSESLSILASSHMTESSSKPQHCYQNKPTFNFDAVGNVENDQKNEEVGKVGPKLNKCMSKSTEDLIKLLEYNLTQETTKLDEEQQICKFETPLNKNTVLANDTLTDTEHKNVVDATNQPEIGVIKSNLDIKSSTPTEVFESSESNETYVIDLTDISDNDPEIDDDEAVENEQDNETISPFIDDLYEINTENCSNDVNQRTHDREPIKIKLPSLKFINLELPQPDEVMIELDNVITSSTHTTHTSCYTGNESVQTDNVTTTVVNYNEKDDDFKRDVENAISNIEKEPKDDTTVSSSSSDTSLVSANDE